MASHQLQLERASPGPMIYGRHFSLLRAVLSSRSLRLLRRERERDTESTFMTRHLTRADLVRLYKGRAAARRCRGAHRCDPNLVRTGRSLYLRTAQAAPDRDAHSQVPFTIYTSWHHCIYVREDDGASVIYQRSVATCSRLQLPSWPDLMDLFGVLF